MVMLLGVIVFACASGCGGGSSGSTSPTAEGLQPFADAQAMESYLKTALQADAQAPIQAYPVNDTKTAEFMAASTSFTTTNLQEAGVDESDRFKTDGQHFFILGRDPQNPNDSLLIRRRVALTAGEPAAGAGSTQIASLGLPADARYSQAYLAVNRPEARPDLLLAIGEPSPPRIAMSLTRDWFVPQQWSNGRTELQWIDVSAPAAPQTGRRLSLDGYLVSSRRTGETLWVIHRFTPSLPAIDPVPVGQTWSEARRKQIEAARLQDLLPTWAIDGVTQGPLVGPQTCYLPSGVGAPASPDLIIISAIDLSAPQQAPRSQCLAGRSEAVYMSTEALYLATSRQPYEILPVTVGSTDVLTRYPAEMQTEIHKFALAAQSPRYRGSGSVTGHLGWESGKKSFRMGEQDGVLRVVTSLGSDWDGSATTRLTLLREGDGRLAKIAELPNASRPAPIGKPGERLYAARFVGNRAYLVTFRVTDPLYVLDLSNPADPRLAGELAIPGYSDYLHPLGERWLIGVGKAAVPDTSGVLGDGRGAWYQGVKVALFDVGDPAAPREIDSRVIGRRGSETAVSWNHHAFTLLPTGRQSGEIARLALPVERADRQMPGMNPDDPATWYGWTDTSLHLFSVTDTGLAARSEIVAESRAVDGEQKLNIQDDRGFLDGNSAHYLHGMKMWAVPW